MLCFKLNQSFVRVLPGFEALGGVVSEEVTCMLQCFMHVLRVLQDLRGEPRSWVRAAVYVKSNVQFSLCVCCKVAVSDFLTRRGVHCCVVSSCTHVGCKDRNDGVCSSSGGAHVLEVDSVCARAARTCHG